MSLEQALAANTAALQALTAALSSGTVLPHPAPSAQPAPIVAPSTVAVAPVPTAPVATLDISPAPTTAFAQPAPIAPAPVTTAAPPTASPAASGSIERDSKGMPWDGRIHASSKAKVADGSWRYKRGVDDTTIAPIEAEIRAALAAPVGGSPAFAPHPFYDVQQVQPSPAGVAPPPPVAIAPAAPAPVVAPPPAAPVAVPVPPVAPVTAITTYDTLMAALPPKIVSGELTAAQMQEACEQYGVPSIAALAQRPDLVPFIAAALKL